MIFDLSIDYTDVNDPELIILQQNDDSIVHKISSNDVEIKVVKSAAQNHVIASNKVMKIRFPKYDSREDKVS